MLLIALANGFGWMDHRVWGIPKQVTGALEGPSDRPVIYLLMVNMMQVVTGCVMDDLATMIILASYLLPMDEQSATDASAFRRNGCDQVHL